MKGYIEKIKRLNPDLFEGENPTLKDDSICFVGSLNDMKKYLLEGEFSVLGEFPRSLSSVEGLMDFCLTWNGPDYYIAYAYTEDKAIYGFIEILEDFIKKL